MFGIEVEEVKTDERLTTAGSVEIGLDLLALGKDAIYQLQNMRVTRLPRDAGEKVVFMRSC